MTRHVTLTLANAFASILFATSASGADVPRAPEPLIPYQVPALLNWTGYYLGAHLGWGWSNAEAERLTSMNGSGFLGGIQAGLNYQFAPNWLVGLEGEVSWSGIEGEGPLAQEINWIATLAPRLGYVVGSAVFYAKGGLAWAGVDLRADPTLQALSDRESKVGWFVGVGVEHVLWNRVSAKIEYNYVDLGASSVTLLGAAPPGNLPFEIDQQAHLLKIGLNYRFGAPAFVPPY